MKDITKDSALVLAEKIRRGEIKIAEVLDSVYESEEQNRRLNCFITLCRERAYEKGAEIQKRIDAGENISPLAGVPIGIKDNIAVSGVRMTCGSRMLENYVPPVSAAAVMIPSGNWSGYPPHRHDIDNLPAEINMEETYFYRFDPPQGFGIQKVYQPDGSIDETYTVKQNDTVAIAEGYHPLCGAPGYQMYYLWTMCGPVNRGLISSQDPAHSWVK